MVSKVSRYQVTSPSTVLDLLCILRDCGVRVGELRGAGGGGSINGSERYPPAVREPCSSKRWQYTLQHGRS